MRIEERRRKGARIERGTVPAERRSCPERMVGLVGASGKPTWLASEAKMLTPPVQAFVCDMCDVRVYACVFRKITM